MSSSSYMQQPTEEFLAEDRGHILVGLCAFLIVIETTFVILRFYARHVGRISLGYDDAVIPLAWLVNVACNIVAIDSVYDAGVGRHVQAVEATKQGRWVVAWAKGIFAVEILYFLGSALPKLSIILFYLRIFVKPVIRWVCYFLLAYTIAVWLAFTIAAVLQCTPPARNWDPALPGHCFNVVTYYKATSAPNVFSDVIIAVLPLPMVAKLHASLGRKLGLLLVFLTGSIGLIGSCVRMGIFFKFNAFVDNTWVSVDLSGWSCVEPGMYLIAACLLTLGPLLNKIPIKALRSQRESEPEKTTRNASVVLHQGSHVRQSHCHTKSYFIETIDESCDSFTGLHGTEPSTVRGSTEVDLENDGGHGNGK